MVNNGRVPDRLRAFIVDDDEILRMALADTLRVFTEVDVVGEAATAEQALEQAPDADPDVVLIDLRMPGMGGLEGSRHLRRLLPDACILVFTAYADNEFVNAAEEAGADGYLVKGSPVDTLVTSIGEALDRRARTRAEGAG